MTFSCTLISGLILSFICFRGSHEQVFVDQSPSSITATEGESAKITCCWNETKANSQLKVAWTKNGGRITEERINQMSRVLNCSVLNIIDMVINDTGDYVCKVIKDIPFLTEYEGIKTVLSVNEVQQTTTPATTQATAPAVSHSAATKPDGVEHPKDNYLNPRVEGSVGNVVIIYIFRSLPIICLLAAFFYLNRKTKPVTLSNPVECAVESREGPDENMEAEETQRNETEEVQLDKNVSEQEEERVNTELTTEENKQETEEEEKTFLAVDTEQTKL